jgi:RimJ/RimL family protein N-acetyltransferase
MEFDLSPFSPEDERDLLTMVNDDDSFAHIGQGIQWTPEKTKQFLKFCSEDETLPPSARCNYYWAVRIKGRLVGMVGLHTIKYDKAAIRGEKKFFATFLVSRTERGRSLGVLSLQAAIERFQKAQPLVTAVFADIHESNARSLRALEKAGFSFVEDPTQADGHARLRVGKKLLLRLRLNLKLIEREEAEDGESAHVNKRAKNE